MKTENEKHLVWWNALKHYEKQGYSELVFPLTVGKNYHILEECHILDIYREVSISEGRCVSDRGTEHCVMCVDVCKAFQFKISLSDLNS